MDLEDSWFCPESLYLQHNLMSPSCFRNKDLRNLKNLVLIRGHFFDVDFTKTRLHFMKVSDDLFRILSSGTYFKVLHPVKSDQVYTRDNSEGHFK